MDITIANESQMEDLGARLAQACRGGGAVIYLRGKLGAGKTTMVRGFLRALGYAQSVKSPTYTLVEPYHMQNRRIYHFDLYRLVHAHELEQLGIRDYLEAHAILLIEWPERGEDVLPAADFDIQIEYRGEGRRVTARSVSARGDEIARRLIESHSSTD